MFEAIISNAAFEHSVLSSRKSAFLHTEICGLPTRQVRRINISNL